MTLEIVVYGSAIVLFLCVILQEIIIRSNNKAYLSLLKNSQKLLDHCKSLGEDNYLCSKQCQYWSKAYHRSEASKLKRDKSGRFCK